MIDPSTGNYPLPPAGVCPPWFKDSLQWYGTAYRTRIPVPTEGGVYLGWRYNVDATPHSRPPYCPHAVGNVKCEQLTACQAPEGPDFYMALRGGWPNDGGATWQRCDKFSNNAYYCHHKPRPNETGLTAFCAVKAGDAPPSDPFADPHCAVVNVQAN